MCSSVLLKGWQKHIAESLHGREKHKCFHFSVAEVTAEKILFYLFILKISQRNIGEPEERQNYYLHVSFLFKMFEIFMKFTFSHLKVGFILLMELL